MVFDFNFYTEADEERGGVEPLPQNLCHQCGKCCRSVATFFPYYKLLEFAEKNEKEASEFLEIFEPYPSIEDARKAIPEQVDQVIEVVKTRSNMKIEELTFYYCRYISDQNLCTIYERRPNCCKDAPYHGWTAMPPGCGFESWQFYMREKQKKLIRELKESLYIMEKMSPDGKNMPTRNVSLDELRKIVDEKIKPWKRFGAEYW